MKPFDKMPLALAILGIFAFTVPALLSSDEAIASPGVHQTGTPVRSTGTTTPKPATPPVTTDNSAYDNGTGYTAETGRSNMPPGVTTNPTDAQCDNTSEANKNKKCVCVGERNNGSYSDKQTDNTVKVRKIDANGIAQCWWSCVKSAVDRYAAGQNATTDGCKIKKMVCTTTDPPTSGGGGKVKTGIMGNVNDACGPGIEELLGGEANAGGAVFQF